MTLEQLIDAARANRFGIGSIGRLRIAIATILTLSVSVESGFCRLCRRRKRNVSSRILMGQCDAGGPGQLFDCGETAVSVRVFVAIRLEGFALRQVVRAEKRKQQRKLRVRATASAQLIEEAERRGQPVIGHATSFPHPGLAGTAGSKN
jgi:hypothetical protein